MYHFFFSILLGLQCHLEAIRKRKAPRAISRKIEREKGLTEGRLSGMIVHAPDETKHPMHRTQEPWCSGPTCLPVTQKIAGSNPVGSALLFVQLF